MRRILVPIAIHLAAVAIMVLTIDTPLRVHSLAAACLALALLAPSWLLTRTASRWRRLSVSAGFAFATMLAWDASAHLVIVKAEPFWILREFPVAWFIGGLGLSLLAYLTVWMAMPRSSGCAK